MPWAKALGIEQTSVGILNVTEPSPRSVPPGAGKKGYTINWAKSSRAEGRPSCGNDVLAGTPDVLVTDSLTGNIMVKMLSALNTGGSIESVGYGYGPGVGEG